MAVQQSGYTRIMEKVEYLSTCTGWLRVCTRCDDMPAANSSSRLILPLFSLQHNLAAIFPKTKCRVEVSPRVEGRDTAVTVTSSSNTAPIAAAIEAILFDFLILRPKDVNKKEKKLRSRNFGENKGPNMREEYDERST